MPISRELLTVYSEVVVCADTCPGIRNEPENGAMGRSFYCPYDPSGITLMMVSKNPGMGVPQERQLYKPLSAANRVQAHENFVRRRFEGNNPLITSNYHANILEWVAIILDVEPTHEAVFSKAAMTALAKCESLADKTTALPESTIMHCSSKFLFREIDLIKPKYILALGNEVQEFLTRPAIQQLHGLPVGKLYHPSWTNMRGGVARYKSEVLPEIRADYLQACK